MIYLIDTSIAYYLSGVSKDINFNKQAFIDSSIPKFISSISIIELYLKYDIKIVKQILNKLVEYKVYVIVFGDEVNHNESISLKKLAKKPNSYLKRMVNYFEKISLDYTAKNVMYLGILIGGMYTYLLNIKKKGNKIKNVNFNYIGFKNNKKKDLLELIKQDIVKYYKTKEKEDCNNIFDHIKLIKVLAIVDYLCTKHEINSKRTQNDYFEIISRINLNGYKLMSKVCKLKQLKQTDIINKFYSSLNSDNQYLDFRGLENIVELLFCQNNLEWNDFADFEIISIAEKIAIKKYEDCAIITSEKSKQKFLKEHMHNNKCAKLSYNELLKFYQGIDK